MRWTSSGSRATGSSRRRNVRCGSTAGDHGARRDLLAAREHDARDAAVLLEQTLDRGAGADLAPAARGRARERSGQRAEAALHEHAWSPRRCRRRRRPAAAGSRSCPPTTGPPACPGCRAPRRRPRRSGVSNHSCAKSATAIGPQRRRSWPSARPSRRSAQPNPASGNRSREVGPLDVRRRQLEQRAEHGRDPAERARGTPGSARASFAEKRASSRGRARRIAAEAQRRGRRAAARRRAAPAAIQLEAVRSGGSSVAHEARAERARPCGRRSRPGSPGGTPRSRPRRPRSSRRSSTSGFRPAFASSAAAARPFGPPPMTTTSAFTRRSPDPVLQHLERREAARRAHDPAARVRRRAAHVEAARSACGSAPSPAPAAGRRAARGDSSPWKMLPSVRLALALEVERRQHLAVQDDAS